MQFAWADLPDNELLKMRLCDLHVRIEGSELEDRVRDLYNDLATRGLPLRPECYLSSEWFSPEGSPVIAIPFYLAHPRLKQLELHQVLEVEGGTYEWCMQILRHECGHAYDHAYQFSSTDAWVDAFGDRGVEYQPETYRPRPYSKSFVRHLPNWYAQAHPDEDFAETFAVWLTLPPEEWRSQYRGWKAVKKLEAVDAMTAYARSHPPAVTKGRRPWDAARSRQTLEKHYAAKRRLWAEDFPDIYDVDLRAIFGNGEPGDESASQLMRRHRSLLINTVTRWTGQRKYVVRELVKQLVTRCGELALPAPRDRTQLLIELASYLAALVTNHLHTGRFKRSY
jgi:putative zinc-binding metallo-peptidase